jgi:hypothetical protein
MKPKHLYLVLVVFSLVVPYLYFASFLFDHVSNRSSFLRQLSGTPVSELFTTDLVLYVRNFRPLPAPTASPRRRQTPVPLCIRSQIGRPLVCDASRHQRTRELSRSHVSRCWASPLAGSTRY